MTTNNALNFDAIINQLVYSPANGQVSGLATAIDSVLVTDGSGVPSLSSTLPAAVVSSILGNAAYVTTTYDVSTASGNQAITGVGFLPKQVILFANVGGSAGVYTSYGMGNASIYGCIYYNTTITNVSTNVIYLASSTNSAVATIASLDSDGFTLSWVKTGTPTGTARLFAFCVG